MVISLSNKDPLIAVPSGEVLSLGMAYDPWWRLQNQDRKYSL